MISSEVLDLLNMFILSEKLKENISIEKIKEYHDCPTKN